MLNDTQIKEKLENPKFIKLIKKFSKDQIECTDHAFFRLSQKQREIFTCDELKRILLKENPFLVGLQYNGNYAVFHKYKDKSLKIIIKILDGKVNIVTFYFIKEWKIPKL